MHLPENSAPFWDHVEDLRRTFIRCLLTIVTGTALSLFFYKPIIQFLTLPVANIQQQLVILGPVDGLLTTFKTGFWVGLVGTSPLWSYFLMTFVSPALKKNERNWILPFVALSLTFLSIGFMFAYNVTIPFANQFLSAFNQEVGVNLWTMSNYIDFTLILLLSNALAFELCIILFFLVHFEKIKHETLKKNRKYFIVGAFILSAILTPPDIFTQIMLALPLLGIYELAILYGKLRNRSNKA